MSTAEIDEYRELLAFMTYAYLESMSEFDYPNDPWFDRQPPGAAVRRALRLLSKPPP